MTTHRSSNRDAVTIRPLRTADTDFAARLHADTLPHGFFVRIGRGFLREYYRSFAESPLAVAFVAEVDGAPAGILVGTTDQAGHYRLVVRRWWWRFGAWALVGICRRPALAMVFIRTRARRYARGLVRLTRRNPQPTSVSTRSAVGVLTHLAVVREHRDAGVGGALVRSYVDAAAANGARSLQVATLAGADGAGGFYERLGWTQTTERPDVEGQVWTIYTRTV